MALAKFALPLDGASVQSGDITFRELVNAGQSVTFQLSNVSSGSTNSLDLITTKNGGAISHPFSTAVSGGTATVTLTTSQMQAVSADADGVDWDYVEALWTVGNVDSPDPSVMHELQSGQTYDLNFWPPKPKK
jgi:hypothetical protein